MISERLYVEKNVNLVIKNTGISSVLFPQLFTYSGSNIKFDIDNIGELTVKYKHFFSVSSTTTLDFTKAALGVKFQSIESDYRYNRVQLGRTLFSKSLHIEA